MKNKNNSKYIEKYSAIRDFTNLGIKNRKNFSRKEKWLISRYYNLLKDTGYIEFDSEENKYVQKVKFVKNKKSNVKYAPKVKGTFIAGARPADKIGKSGKIIRENYSKEFIPLNFQDLPVDDELIADIVSEELFEALTPYYEDLKSNDYFTIVLQNGWEIGQNQKAKTAKKDRKEGKAITKGAGAERKFDILSDIITELLIRSINKYKAGEDLIKGLYLWQFYNQREPTAKEKKAIKGGKKKRK